MAATTARIQIPRNVVTEMLGKVKDTSTIAALSPSQPQTFADTDHLVFVPTAEAEVVAEGAKKGSYDASVKPVEGKRVKVVTTTRVSDELRWADEDNQLYKRASHFGLSQELNDGRACQQAAQQFLR